MLYYYLQVGAKSAASEKKTFKTSSSFLKDTKTSEKQFSATKSDS